MGTEQLSLVHTTQPFALQEQHLKPPEQPQVWREDLRESGGLPRARARSAPAAQSLHTPPGGSSAGKLDFSKANRQVSDHKS